MRSVLALVMLFAAPALAQPVTHPEETCDVHIVRAPDAVRTAVQAWLDGERCNISLEVRIIPTDNGLYLLSRDPLGRVHERVVPDAQAAGLLIASWAADDGIAAPVVTPPPPITAPTPALELELRVAPPGMIRPRRTRTPATPARRRNRWASFGAGESMHGGGVRASADLWNRGNWIVGANGTLSTNRLPLDGYPYIIMSGEEVYLPFVDTLDARVLAYAGRDIDLGQTWHVRGTVGFGALYTHATANTQNNSNGALHYAMTGFVPHQEAALSISHDIGNAWGFEVGAVTSYYREVLSIGDNQLRRNQLEFLFIGALRHQI